MSVSNRKIAGPAENEFAYSVIVAWIPASCSAAATDIGKYYTVCESALAKD